MVVEMGMVVILVIMVADGNSNGDWSSNNWGNGDGGDSKSGIHSIISGIHDTVINSRCTGSSGCKSSGVSEGHTRLAVI